MIVIHRRNDHTSPFAFQQRHHHAIPRSHHCHGSYGHPFYSHRPSPSFYSSPFDQFEAAVMSPYRPRPRPRRFRAEVLGPMVFLAHRMKEDESKALSEKAAKTTEDLPDGPKPTVATKPEVPKTDAESSIVKPDEITETKEDGQNQLKKENTKENTSSKEEIDPCKAFLEMFQLMSRPTFQRRCQRKSHASDTHVDRNEKEVTVTTDVSGYDAADLTVAYDSGVLTVEGKHNDESGLGTSSFACRIPLNERRFHVDSISARLVDDKLVVSVPRRSPSEPRTIAIESVTTTEKSEPDSEQGKDEAADHNVVETKAEKKEEVHEQQEETTDTEVKVDTEESPVVDVVDHAEVLSVSDVSSHKDMSSVSVKTVSADDEDDEDEETYEVVAHPTSP